MTVASHIAGQDRYWMQRALELARRGIGLCSPNPAVGCVILDRNAQVCGEGWHEYDRLDHAEVAALRAARQSAADRARGGSVYVTLEPCNHTGRTPPCTQALIQAGVGRVTIATADPNPNVAGGGVQALRAAGIETSVGVCEAEARRLNEGFARWSESHRPFVLMKVAMSLDGRIAPAAAPHSAHRPYWITGEAARAAVQTLRRQADAVLTGAGTVLADDPLLTDRSSRPRRRPLLRVVLDSRLRIPLQSKIVTTARNDVLIFTVSSDRARIRELESRGVRVQPLPAQGGQVPIGRVLEHLGAEDILSLLTETGTSLNTAFLATGLVDRICVFVSPQVLGSGAVPAFGGMAGAVQFPAVEIERCGNDLALISLLRDPWERQPPGESAGRQPEIPA